ncbi:MAG: hypothetical protein ACRC8Y_13475, partial [Chroococcales cyanobacterium]
KAYERNYGCPYPVEDSGVDDPPEQVKRAVNRRLIQEGEDLSELPYGVESDEYYDIKGSALALKVEEIDVFKLYPKVFATEPQGDKSNPF